MNLLEAPLSARLNWLQFGSSNPEALAGFYAQVFGMHIENMAASWICRGPGRCLVFSAGQPNTLLSAGYAVAEPSMLDQLRGRAADHLDNLNAIDAELFSPDAIAVRDPDGNRMVYGTPNMTVVTPAADTPPARLQHVVVGSTNISRMVTFYTTTIGMRESDEVVDDNGVMRTCFMRSDEEHHSFAVFTTPENRLDHHCYELPDWNGIRDWGDRLASHRIPVKWGPGRHGPGNNLFLFFHDPDGNWLELSTELEIVEAQRPVGIWRHEERTLNSWGRGLLRS